MSNLFCLPFLVWTLATYPVSGPEVGKEVPELKVTPVRGDENCKPEVVVKKGQKDLVVVVLIRRESFDRPAARFLRLLVEQCAKDHPSATIHASWVNDEMEPTIDWVEKIQGSLKLDKLKYSAVDKGDETLQPWGLSTKAAFTVVVGKEGKVAYSGGYEVLNEGDVKKVAEILKK